MTREEMLKRIKELDPTNKYGSPDTQQNGFEHLTDDELDIELDYIEDNVANEDEGGDEEISASDEEWMRKARKVFQMDKYPDHNDMPLLSPGEVTKRWAMTDEELDELNRTTVWTDEEIKRRQTMTNEEFDELDKENV